MNRSQSFHGFELVGLDACYLYPKKRQGYLKEVSNKDKPAKSLKRFMRLDRAISLKLMRPVRRLLHNGGSVNAASVPILMYHSISNKPEEGVQAYYRVKTTPAVFRRQMEYLAENGYRSFDLAEVVQRLREGKLPPSKAVVITFDDGFRDFYQEAYPVLKEHGFTATVFLATAFIGEQRGIFQPASTQARGECLTWAEVRELQAAGIRFGSHTVTHPKLADLPWAEIRRELIESKAELETRIGEPIGCFAHPYAFPQAHPGYVPRLKDIMTKAGYCCCATTIIGQLRTGDDPYLLPRLPMNSLDDEDFFKAKLNGDYDWARFPQRFRRHLRQVLGRS